MCLSLCLPGTFVFVSPLETLCNRSCVFLFVYQVLAVLLSLPIKPNNTEFLESRLTDALVLIAFLALLVLPVLIVFAEYPTNISYPLIYLK